MAKKAEATLLLKVKTTGAKALGGIKKGFQSIGKSAAVTFAATGALLATAISKFKVQELAINSVEAALKNQGLPVEELSNKYQKLASAIQKRTTAGDEEILQGLALVQGFAGQLEITEELTQSIVDFAAAQKIDLKSAFSLVGKSIGGPTNALARYGIEMDTSATNAQKMALITGKLTEKFGGQAAAAADGLGALDQLSNTFGDLFEVIGKELAPVIVFVAKKLKSFIEIVQENKQLVKFVAILGTVIGVLAGVAAGIAGTIAVFNPLTLAVVAVIAAVTALAITFEDDIVSMQTIAFGVFGAIEAFIVNFVKNATSMFGGLGDLLAGVFTFDMDQIKKGIADIGSAIDDTTNQIIGGFVKEEKARANHLVNIKALEEKNIKEIEAKKKISIGKVASVEKAKIIELQLAEKKAADKAAIDLEKNIKRSRDKIRAQIEADDKAFQEQQKAEQDQILADQEAEQAESAARTGEIINGALSGGFQGGAQAGVAALGEIFLPGFGGAIGQAFGLLTQSTDEFANTLNQMLSVEFIDNLHDNMIVLIETIVEKLPEIVQALIRSILAHSPQIAIALAKAVTDPEFIAALIKAIFQGFGEGVKLAVTSIKNEIQNALTFPFPPWLKTLKEIVQKISSIGGGGGGVIGKIGSAIGFNDGGIITRMAGGGVVDNTLISATPGEAILSQQAVADNPGAVNDLLQGRSPQGQGGGTVINLTVNGGMLGDEQSARQLAQAIDSELLKLRQGNESLAFDSAVV